VIRVRQGGRGRVSVAALACFRPGFRTRLICRYHEYRGRKGETKAFTWPEYADLVTAAPGGQGAVRQAVETILWLNRVRRERGVSG